MNLSLCSVRPWYQPTYHLCHKTYHVTVTWYHGRVTVLGVNEKNCHWNTVIEKTFIGINRISFSRSCRYFHRSFCQSNIISNHRNKSWPPWYHEFCKIKINSEIDRSEKYGVLDYIIYYYR